METQQAGRTIPGVIAYLTMPDANEALAYYQETLGATLIDKRPTEDGRLMHCHLDVNGGALMFCDAFPDYGHPYVPPQGYMLVISSPEAQDWWDRMAAGGMDVVSPIKVEFWGDLFGVLKDRYGLSWAVTGPAPAAAAA